MRRTYFYLSNGTSIDLDTFDPQMLHELPYKDQVEVQKALVIHANNHHDRNKPYKKFRHRGFME